MPALEPAMQTIILTARATSGATRKFYVNVGDHDAQMAQARRFAGKGGTVKTTRRERLNDYVGAPVWGPERFVSRRVVR